jgi:hypothetical protein
MTKHSVEKYYVSHQPKLLRQYDKTAVHVRAVMIPRYGEEMTGQVLQQARKEYKDLIPSLPCIGGGSRSIMAWITRNAPSASSSRATTLANWCPISAWPTLPTVRPLTQA